MEKHHVGLAVLQFTSRMEILYATSGNIRKRWSLLRALFVVAGWNGHARPSTLIALAADWAAPLLY